VLTTETGDGQVVKLHREVVYDKTEGRSLLGGTIAHSARDGVCPEPRTQPDTAKRKDVDLRSLLPDVWIAAHPEHFL
jgi:hypothetical protein